MTKQITVIGLDQPGASLGLALAEFKQSLIRVGHDADGSRMKQAEKLGAFDKTCAKITDAVRGADIVVLSLPVDVIRDGLAMIASNLKPGSVVMDMSVMNEGVTAWARELLPDGVQFVSIVPVLNPRYMDCKADELNEIHADLFENGILVIASEYKTDEAAFQTAIDLANLLKAKPLFCDPHEADGLIAAAEQLPRLAAAALVYASTANPGWKDSRMLTSQAFFRSVSANQLPLEQEFLGMNLLVNKENILGKLDQYIQSLMDLRDMINEGDEESLKKYMKQAQSEFDLWLAQRKSSDWGLEKKQEMPGLKERLFGARKPKEK